MNAKMSYFLKIQIY